LRGAVVAGARATRGEACGNLSRFDNRWCPWESHLPPSLQLELIPAIGYVVVTRAVNVDGYSWAVTYSGCRAVGTGGTLVCNNDNVPELGVVSVTGAGTPSVVETLRGSGTAAYGSEVRDAWWLLHSWELPLSPLLAEPSHDLGSLPPPPPPSLPSFLRPAS
jgi:hypothetical protein